MKIRNFLILALFILSSCNKSVSKCPPENFDNDMLLGVWQSSNGLYSVEELEIFDDMTFFQRMYTSNGDLIFEVQGQWDIENSEADCKYLHMSGMIFYYQAGTENLEKGDLLLDNPQRYYWNDCEDKGITMIDEVVLSIGSHPESQNGIILRHMTTQRDGQNIVLIKVDDTLD